MARKAKTIDEQAPPIEGQTGGGRVSMSKPAAPAAVAVKDREFVLQKEGADGKLRRFYFVPVPGAPRVEIDCDGEIQWAYAYLDDASAGDVRHERECAQAYARAW